MKMPITAFRSFTAALAATVALCLTAVSVSAADKSVAEKKLASEKPETPAKPPSAGPFHGKLAALDKSAKTITVGKRTFLVTAESKIHKAGKPAHLEDGVVGEPVSGYVKPTADGKLVATTINFGPKPDTKK